MRTTLNIDDDLLAEAREYAARKGQSLSAVIREALREVLLRSRQRKAKERKRVRITVARVSSEPGFTEDHVKELLEEEEGERLKGMGFE